MRSQNIRLGEMPSRMKASPISPKINKGSMTRAVRKKATISKKD